MVLVIFLLIISSVSFGNEALTIRCDSNKNLAAEIQTQASCSECEKIKILDEPKEIGQLSKELKTKVAVNYAKAGPNKVLQSPNYDVKVFRKLIELGLQNDIDPYLLLSITLLESPPLISANRGFGYEHGYGDLPIDAFPLYDMLGCLYKKPKDNSFMYATDLQAKEFSEIYAKRDRALKQFKPYENEFQRFRNFLVKQTGSDGPHVFKILEALQKGYSNGCPINDVKKEISDRFCSNQEIRKATDLKVQSTYALNDVEKSLNNSKLTALQKIEIQARFDFLKAGASVANKTIPEFRLDGAGGTANFFCSEPRSITHGSPSTFSPSDLPINGSCCAKVIGLTDKNDFLNLMAARFLKNKIGILPGQLSSLSLDIQKYNGLGKIGTTEGLDNKCLNGLNMKLRPYYGARAADLIINSLLSNKEINTLVQEASQNLKKPVTSILCQKLGSGLHQIEKNQFLNQQKDFLISERPESEKFCAGYFKQK
jgi:hypothetical protein